MVYVNKLMDKEVKEWQPDFSPKLSRRIAELKNNFVRLCESSVAEGFYWTVLFTLKDMDEKEIIKRMEALDKAMKIVYKENVDYEIL